MTSFRRFDAEAAVVYAPLASEILGKDHWHLTSGFYYYLGGKYSDAWVYVPAGFLTDGASVPRIFWGLVPPWGKYGQAAIVHDYLCEFLTVTVCGEQVKITRERADEIFLEAMEALEVPVITRKTMYAAVSSYRIIARVTKPTSVPLRRQLENDWIIRRNLKWQPLTNLLGLSM